MGLAVDARIHGPSQAPRTGGLRVNERMSETFATAGCSGILEPVPSPPSRQLEGQCENSARSTAAWLTLTTICYRACDRALEEAMRYAKQ